MGSELEYSRLDKDGSASFVDGNGLYTIQLNDEVDAFVLSHAPFSALINIERIFIVVSLEHIRTL